MRSLWECVLRQFAALLAIVTMGIAPIEVLNLFHTLSYIHRSDDLVGSVETVVAAQAQKLSAMEAELQAAKNAITVLQNSQGDEWVEESYRSWSGRMEYDINYVTRSDQKVTFVGLVHSEL